MDFGRPGRERYSTPDLVGILDTAPERISPAALLRPVFQDYLLGTSLTIGGPAENAYFAQSAVLFEKILGRMTLGRAALFSHTDRTGDRRVAARNIAHTRSRFLIDETADSLAPVARRAGHAHPKGSARLSLMRWGLLSMPNLLRCSNGCALSTRGLGARLKLRPTRCAIR